MKCINEELIQKYIDGETTLQEETFIHEHIFNCEACAKKIEAQKELAAGVKATFAHFEHTEVDIPIFKLPTEKTKIVHHKFKRYIYSISAACFLVLIFFVFQTQKQSPETKVVFLYNFESEYDANRTLSQQELIINVIDAEGKVSEYKFE